MKDTPTVDGSDDEENEGDDKPVDVPVDFDGDEGYSVLGDSSDKEKENDDKIPPLTTESDPEDEILRPPSPFKPIAVPSGTASASPSSGSVVPSGTAAPKSGELVSLTDTEEAELEPITTVSKRKRLKAEAKILIHQLFHGRYNPYCRVCRCANRRRTSNRRRKLTDIIKPKKFGHCTADPFYARDKIMAQSVTGDRDALVVYDIGTDFGYVYRQSAKGADAIVESLVNFFGRQVSQYVFTDQQW